MAKKASGFISLTIMGGAANPSPPVGPALGQHGVNIMGFCKEFNAKTQGMELGSPVPVEISIYSDRSFTFEMKTPPASFLIKKAVDVIQGRFPMRLGNHAAFHTSLQTPVAAEGRGMLSADLFRQPTIPMIDGRGKIWWPDQETQQDLWDYTLNHQVVEMYDFTNAIRVAAREFAPDYFIVTGPGNTLGGAVAQSLILSNWQGLSCKDDFKTLQQQNGLLISMGMAEQRKYVV